MNNGSPELYIDKDGKWYADGAHMFRLEVVKLFSEHIRPLSEGGYEVLWGEKVYPIKVEDVPFVIETLTIEGNNWSIRLSDSRILDFNPDELFIFNDIVYISLFFNKDARFSRKAQWQLNALLTEENGETILNLPAKQVAIRFL